MTALDEILRALKARGYAVNNLFERPDGKWQANLRAAGGSGLCTGWAVAAGPIAALEAATASLPKETVAPAPEAFAASLL